MIAVQQFAGPAVKSGPALLDLLLRPGKHCLAVRFGLGTLACGGFRFRVALLLGAGLQVRSLGLCLCKDLLGFGFRLSAQSAGSGIGVFVCCEHRCNVFISRSLRRFKHLVQLQCSLRNGTCVFNMDLPFLQLGRQGSVFCPELVLALLERQNDLD